MKKKYWQKTLPKKFTKLIVNAVLGNEYAAECSEECCGYSDRRKLRKIKINLPGMGMFYCEEVHEGSYYFNSTSSKGNIRVSNHWRCECSQKIKHYDGYSNIPSIHGKIETYCGFAAVYFNHN